MSLTLVSEMLRTEIKKLAIQQQQYQQQLNHLQQLQAAGGFYHTPSASFSSHQPQHPQQEQQQGAHPESHLQVPPESHPGPVYMFNGTTNREVVASSPTTLSILHHRLSAHHNDVPHQDHQDHQDHQNSSHSIHTSNTTNDGLTLAHVKGNASNSTSGHSLKDGSLYGSNPHTPDIPCMNLFANLQSSLQQLSLLVEMGLILGKITSNLSVLTDGTYESISCDILSTYEKVRGLTNRMGRNQNITWQVNAKGLNTGKHFCYPDVLMFVIISVISQLLPHSECIKVKGYFVSVEECSRTNYTQNDIMTAINSVAEINSCGVVYGNVGVLVTEVEAVGDPMNLSEIVSKLGKLPSDSDRGTTSTSSEASDERSNNDNDESNQCEEDDTSSHGSSHHDSGKEYQRVTATPTPHPKTPGSRRSSRNLTSKNISDAGMGPPTAQEQQQQQQPTGGITPEGDIELFGGNLYAIGTLLENILGGSSYLVTDNGCVFSFSIPCRIESEAFNEMAIIDEEESVEEIDSNIEAAIHHKKGVTWGSDSSASTSLRLSKAERRLTPVNLSELPAVRDFGTSFRITPRGEVKVDLIDEKHQKAEEEDKEDAAQAEEGDNEVASDDSDETVHSFTVSMKTDPMVVSSKATTAILERLTGPPSSSHSSPPPPLRLKKVSPSGQVKCLSSISQDGNNNPAHIPTLFSKESVMIPSTVENSMIGTNSMPVYSRTSSISENNYGNNSNKNSVHGVSTKNVNQLAVTEKELLLKARIMNAIKSENESLKMKPPSPNAAGSSNRSLHVLLVDDSITVLKILSIWLTKNNCIVTQAVNGSQALELMKINAYDLILLDFLMPIMDGLTCLQLFQEFLTNLESLSDMKPDFLEQLSHQWIIGLSATALPEDQLVGFEAGMHLFCTKPVDMQGLKIILEAKRMRIDFATLAHLAIHNRNISNREEHEAEKGKPSSSFSKEKVEESGDDANDTIVVKTPFQAKGDSCFGKEILLANDSALDGEDVSSPVSTLSNNSQRRLAGGGDPVIVTRPTADSQDNMKNPFPRQFQQQQSQQPSNSNNNNSSFISNVTIPSTITSASASFRDDELNSLFGSFHINPFFLK
jgi:CheY-like chemotaxis protein